MAETPAAPALIRGRVRVPAPHGLRRPRLVDPLAGPAAPRLAVVVAPAGSGKSTLLTHVAEAVDGPVAWLTLDPAVSDAGALLAHLRAAFAAALGTPRPPWPSAEAALADLEQHLTTPALLIVDDLQSLGGGTAPAVVRLLVEYQPEALRIVLGSRTTPDLDLARRRLDTSVAEVGADDLRFRTWEVDELFRRCHQVRMYPTEVTELTQRTAGWAAGLQLFHLATYRRPPSNRAQLLRHGPQGTRLTQDYLTRHVLDGVEDGLRTFLVRTSVLDELTGPRCDALLRTTGSADRLAELERNGLFTFADGDGLVFRYHEVLRGHLLDELVRRFGTAQARAMHSQAGRLLEAEGALVEAIRSYCRAEDWEDVRRVLATGGASLAREPGGWIDLLPAAIRDRDPWALLALARRLAAEGSLARAVQMYERAVAGFAGTGGGRAAQEELRWLQAWVSPALGAVSSSVDVLRAVLADPRRHLRPAARPGPVQQDLVLGFAHLVSGDLGRAGAVFAQVTRRPDLSGPVEMAALLATALCRTLATAGADDEAAEAARAEAAAAATALGVPLVSRFAAGLTALAAGDRATVAYLVGECERAEDPWGAATLRLYAELTALAGGTADAGRLAALREDFHGLAAPALAAWAGAGAAVAAALAGSPVPARELAQAERAARATGPLPYALALLAVAAGQRPDTGRSTERLALQVAERAGAGPLVTRVAHRLRAGRERPGPGVAPRPARRDESRDRPGREPGPVGPTASGVRVRCLGGFALEVDGRAVDLAGVRPRHAELLRLLGLHADRVLHRERILEWLWPGRDPERGQHSLQVAVSDLRKLLEPAATRGEWSVIRREGSGYRLVLADEQDSDVRRLDRWMRLARAAAARGEPDAAAEHLRAVIAGYPGDLLPDDGPAEWAAAERDRLRGELAEACERLAALRARAGDHAEAVRLARQGLGHDRYRDGLWQQLVTSLRTGGNPAAAAAAANRYEQVLTELDGEGPGLLSAGR